MIEARYDLDSPSSGSSAKRGSALASSSRKLSRISASEMQDMSTKLNRLFVKESNCRTKSGLPALSSDGLVKLAVNSNILDRRLTAPEVRLIFQSVKLGSDEFVGWDRFQEAVRKMAVKKEVTFQILVQTLCHNSGGQNLRIICATWNVGNAPPPDDLAPWIPAGGGGAHLIAIGAQESSYEAGAIGNLTRAVRSLKSKESVPDKEKGGDAESEAAGESGSVARGRDATENKKERTDLHAEHFFRVIQQHVGPDYEILSAMTESTLKEMRIIVLAHKGIMSKVCNIESTSFNTGIGGVLGNKGGLVVKVEVDRTTFGFVSTHLAAHEDQKKVEKRNKMIGEILAGARVGYKKLEFDVQLHHVFWFGDMNYRLDPMLGESNIEKTKEKEENYERLAENQQQNLAELARTKAEEEAAHLKIAKGRNFAGPSSSSQGAEESGKAGKKKGKGVTFGRAAPVKRAAPRQSKLEKLALLYGEHKSKMDSLDVRIEDDDVSDVSSSSRGSVMPSSVARLVKHKTLQITEEENEDDEEEEEEVTTLDEGAASLFSTIYSLDLI